MTNPKKYKNNRHIPVEKTTEEKVDYLFKRDEALQELIKELCRVVDVLNANVELMIKESNNADK